MNQRLQHKLDKIDYSILSQLQEDGRKPFTEIAKCIGVAANTVKNRVEKMMEEGILNIIPRINALKLGYSAYGEIHIIVRPAGLIGKVTKAISEFPEISFIATTAGEYDIIAEVMCFNIEHYNELLTKRLHKIEGVSGTKSIFFLEVVKHKQPDLFKIETNILENREASPDSSVENIDVKIQVR